MYLTSSSFLHFILVINLKELFVNLTTQDVAPSTTNMDLQQRCVKNECSDCTIQEVLYAYGLGMVCIVYSIFHLPICSKSRSEDCLELRVGGVTDNGEETSSSYGGSDEEEDDDDDDDEEGGCHFGLGIDVFGHARLAAEAGPQTDTVHFADWEAHSRGIASKLLARMGFVKGSGLGKSGDAFILCCWAMPGPVL